MEGLLDNLDLKTLLLGPSGIALGLCLVVAVSAYLYLFSAPTEPPLPETKRIGGAISEILVFPVKSLGGVSLRECEIDEFGFKHDRAFMLARRDVMTEAEVKTKVKMPVPDKAQIHDFVTQREEPQMTLVKPAINEAANTLTLQFKGTGARLEVPLEFSKIPIVTSKSAETVKVIIWGEFVDAYDVEPLSKFYDADGSLVETKTPISDFFTKAVGFKFAATLVTPKSRRSVSEERNGPHKKQINRNPTTSFQDYYPGNLITEASIESLAKRVEERSGEPLKLTSMNFRPNIVLTGTSEAWDEDDWKHITINSKKTNDSYDWFVSCHNVRCQVPTISVKEGTFHANREPYKTMQTFRRIDKGAPYEPCFGMNLVHKTFGYVLSVGDKVTVNKRGPHLYV